VRPPLAPRKRPRQRRSAATVETILDGAARILEAHGLDGFNTNAVAARAGVSVGSLYQYFSGKDAVMAALIRRDSQVFLADARQAVSEADDWDGAVEQLVDAAVAHQLDSPILARILDFEEARLPLDPETARSEAAMQALIEDILRRRPDLGGDLGLSQTAADLLHITRALIDAEGRSNSPDREGLKHRVLRAALGYLNASLTAPYAAQHKVR